MTAIDRFWQKTQRNPDGCWIWNGKVATNGYGRLFVDGTTKPAHRVAYEYLVGPVPAGLELDHLCRNKRCVNPAHLEPVTHAENCRRGDLALGIRSGATHCKYGHEFTPENTAPRQRNGSVHRRCRTCNVRYGKASRRRSLLLAKETP